MLKKLATGVVAALGLAATLVGAASPASATARNGVCEDGEFCLYYNSDHLGSRVDLLGTERDYGTGTGCISFVSSGSGQGECVKNNAASVWNRTGSPVYVFFNSDFGGVSQRIAVDGKVNLNADLKNENASQIVGDAALRFPLATTRANITNRTPHWCWDSLTNCHHDYNAADIFTGTGTSVVSPVSGTVMTRNVRVGSTACTSVGSTVTVKDRFGRLWYFAHMDDSPAPVVTVGQHVAKGDRIGYVGTKYHALCTDPHLHLDMRVGVDERVSCSGSACSGLGFVNNQPLLRSAFLELP